MAWGRCPAIIDTREEEEATELPDGQDIKNGQAKFLQTAIKPNLRNEIKAWTKDVGQGQWVAREPNYIFSDPKPLVGDVAAADEDDDEGE